MRTIKFITIIVISALFTMGAGIKPLSLETTAIKGIAIKSIDLIFANGFEAPVTLPALSSETPFSGSLPALETGHEEVGFTAGEFMVDQTGQASYSIPIFAGVGTAGVAPQISLQYSSAGGNGHVGVEVHLGNKDFVNGLWLGLLFNPFVNMVSLGWGQHAIHRYHYAPISIDELGPPQ